MVARLMPKTAIWKISVVVEVMGSNATRLRQSSRLHHGDQTDPNYEIEPGLQLEISIRTSRLYMEFSSK
jgi:hypothetical protein